MVKLNFSRIKRTLPKVVIIDLCGTILDSLDIDRQVMNEISYTYAGVSYTQLRKKKDRFKSMRHNFSIFFGEMANIAHKDYLKKLKDNIPYTKLFDNSVEFLAFCQIQRVQVCIVSNRSASYVNSVIKQKNLKRVVTMAISAPDELNVEKPSALVVYKILNHFETFNYQPSEVVFIGDSFVDYQCAKNANCVPYVFTGKSSEFEVQEINKRTYSTSNTRTYYFSKYSELLHDWKAIISTI